MIKDTGNNSIGGNAVKCKTCGEWVIIKQGSWYCPICGNHPNGWVKASKNFIINTDGVTEQN